MKYDFDKIIERRGTGSSKWDGVEAMFGSPDVIPMPVADTDFQVPEPVMEALRKRLEHPIFGYTRNPAGLIPAVVDRLRRKYGWEVEPEWILTTPGVVPAVNAAVRAEVPQGGTVVIQSPAYPPFWGIGRNNGVDVVANPLRESDGRFEIDFQDLEERFQKTGAKAIVLCSPHNPVGRVWTREELVRIGEIALAHDAIVISDEIHCELILKGHKHIPFASISPEFEARSVTCFAPSKTFNIAGLHCSVAIIPDPDVRARFNKARAGLMGSPGLFGILAMEAAFRDGDEWLEQMLAYFDENVDIVMDYFAQRIPKIKPVRPEGTYLVWLDCRGLGFDDPQKIPEFFNQKAKVGMNPGQSFGPDGAGFMRMNIGCPKSTLMEALRRIEEAVARFT